MDDIQGPLPDMFMLLPAGISPGVLVEWFLYFAFVVWAVHSLIAIYHWLKYSHGSLIAIPSIAVHLFVSFALITFGLTGILPV